MRMTVERREQAHVRTMRRALGRPNDWRGAAARADRIPRRPRVRVWCYCGASFSGVDRNTATLRLLAHLEQRGCEPKP
jgi:hypothetical protein